ncbi:MAG TPA: bifunctional 4-hydroxy-2-oxoglutarate aldolase/2-dehydro-3-deoxy-phosphogluconate aldolase [Bacillota bacterium]|nr:bifunctional 4-hydroxy-2-oxoglutarate aldolase/2-dehydro-3-deoxy-phosphogluconate aldolase [Bacillota bacterium]HQE66476.1 bifunctional 4-hydroxy-2-oxoglutarate aldolase/2-dehydro-3-deoxy-phosphogluconate aldolase [Bacillota bacterium]HQI16428.1 bifunctional 4-hydroxy-2-oxoglutarate aldolase/2-dehydro-3-deoxy-phosphogluconate aldolase [Bacillota bacterium]HRS20602.1 bifunctional 4-hydroxy-2-oxoglutarate aldolase/2-dehydro-3-deoxy-phosphogluconate aldolase [Clostridia bacterium]
MKNTEVIELIKNTGIVAIMRGIEEEEALHTVEALCNAGVKAVEVTFNTRGADKIILSLLDRFKGDIIVGAGTVTNPAAAAKAVECGAEFVLAPNVDAEVAEVVKSYGKVMVPGAFTPTEVLKCHNIGADIVKIFPVSAVGPKYIKDLRGPYDNIEMMPVGGVDVSNAGEYIKAGSIAVGAGGSLIRKDLLAKGNYKAIEELAEKFIYEINSAR